MELLLGGLDIAHLAKEKGVAQNACVGLADLCAKVLQCHMEKDGAIRVSPEWSQSELSEEQKNYAALDVWASLQIYLSLSEMNVPTPIDFESTPPPPAGLEVFIYQEDRSCIIARGCVSVHSDYRSLDGISITKMRILIDVHMVFVPGAVILTHKGQPLSSFGATPFSIIC